MKAMTVGDFSPLLNQKFTVAAVEAGRDDDIPTAATELELIEVEETGNHMCEGFSLMFRGSADTVLPQRIYHMENETLGELQIFIVPMAGDVAGGPARRQTYQAVFNRLKPVGDAAGQG